MHVVIAIVGFRNSGDIVRCLGALSLSTYADFEVTICENGGAEAFDAMTAAVPARLPSGQTVTVIRAPRNLGYAGGVNVCMRRTPEAEAWWILNPDTEPQPGALAALVARFSQGGCDAVGGTLYGPDGKIQMRGGLWRSWFARAVAMGFGESLSDAVDVAAVERNQSFLSGACMLVGKRFVEAIGLMREDYFLYCEETEWCLRGLAHGLRLGFAPDALVLHLHGATTGAAVEHRQRPRTPIYLDERNKMLLTQDRFPLRLAVAAPAALAQLFLRYGVRGAWRQFGYGVSGWWAGLLGRRGPPAWITP
jgi:GT2 family glycosyltransferase